MVEQEKAKLTFADFIGTSDGKADGNGLHMAYTNGRNTDLKLWGMFRTVVKRWNL